MLKILPLLNPKPTAAGILPLDPRLWRLSLPHNHVFENSTLRHFFNKTLL